MSPAITTFRPSKETWRHGRKARILGTLLLAPILAVALWTLLLRLTGNIHAVEPGVVYRSGQLGAAQLAKEIRSNGIKSIINLRGTSPEQAWYKDELAVSSALDVRHYDLR